MSDTFDIQGILVGENLSLLAKLRKDPKSEQSNFDMRNFFDLRQSCAAGPL
jgi:hypothetical protein